MNEESRSQRAKRFAHVFSSSRNHVGISQEKLAMELGVSRKTIQNWEAGVSSPTFFQSCEWFRVLGLNPLPYYFGYVFPDQAYEIDGDIDDAQVDLVLNSLVQNLTPRAKRQLLFLLYGNHGSSPNSVLEMVNAHLQTPLRQRIINGNTILHNYELSLELEPINCPKNIKPDTTLLRSAISKARRAVIDGRKGYSVDPD